MTDMRSVILSVNDQPARNHLLRALLEPTYEVLLAGNGPSALQMVASSPQIDLILLDVLMPGMNGYEVCEQLKTDLDTWDIPVIFLTAMIDEAAEAYGLGLGAVDFITDPIHPSTLLARVKTHLALAKSRKTLVSRSLELADRNHSLEWTHQQLKETLESRMQLINTVSHDLRSPLTSISLCVGQIREGTEVLPPKAARIFEILAQEANRLNAMVAGVLDKNRAESLAQRLTLTPSRPRQVLANLEGTLLFKAEDRGLRAHLHFEPESLDAQVMLDVSALQQVLFNLVENALKFTDPPGDIGVRSTLQGPAWLLEVWDSGRGIPKAECERLFQTFEQSQQKDAQKGWGLGLFICRAILAAHGGRIEVDSDLGKGAIFRIFIPLALG